MAKTIKKAPVKKAAPAPRAVKVKPPSMLELTLRICVALEVIAANSKPVVLTAMTSDAPDGQPIAIAAPVVAAPAGNPPPPPATTSLTMIREQINAKVGEGKQDNVVALLAEYDATAGSNLAEEHYTAFYNKLIKL